MSRWTPIAWVVCVLLSFAKPARTAEPPPPIVRHVFVPADKPKTWPEGDRVPVLFSEYQELREAVRERPPQRRAAHIEWQSLSATFDAARGVLTDGRWTAEVRGGSELPQLMSLEPLSLAMSDLKWSDGDAVWGTSPSGEVFVQVDAAAKRLEGKFSRQGRRLQRTWQVPLRLAVATVTEIKLRVPAKFTLRSSAGHLRGPLSSGEEGWRLWQLNLGSQSRCDLLVIDTPAVAPTEPVVVYEQTSSYVLREAEVELQCEVNAEVFHTPKAALSFTIPDDLSVTSVGFAGDSRLPWRELPRAPGQARHIEVQLPEPQIGRVRALQILAGTAAKWEPNWALPRIVLDGGWFTSGRWNVSVDAPLIWRSLKPTGLRLSEVDANAPNVRRLSFLQYLADASLAIDISYPEPRVSSRGLQRLTVHDNEWRVTSEWHWQSTSGSTFAARWRVPAGWEIRDVVAMSGAATADVRHWDVVTDPSGERTLVCDFATPLEDRATQRLRVTARRSRSLAADRDVFELPTPLDCRLVDQLLVVTLPTGWQWREADDAVPAPTAIKRLAEPWNTFDLWKTDVGNWGETTLLTRVTHGQEGAASKLEFVVGEPIRALPNQAVDIADRPPEVHTETAPAAAPPAVTEQLVWTSAELRSLLFPGADGEDRHALTLRAAHSTRVGRLEFELPEPARLASVRINGVRAEPEQNENRFRLPAIPQGGLQVLEIQYSSPSSRDFLRNRQTVPVPRVDATVLGFRWLFALPPNARLAEEPNGLRLLQPLDPTPWLRRFFGPLGRDESATWFNPTSPREWSELWQPTEPADPPRSNSSTTFAPLGWKVREAAAPTMPAHVTWLTWNSGQVRVLAWIGMLFSISVGCLLRSRRVSPRVHIAAFWLGLCVVGVVLSSPVTAEILGGGLIGTLIAVLIPRRLVMSYSSRRDAVARGAFDATIVAQRVVTTALVVAVVTWSAFAQQSDTTNSATRNNGAANGVPRFDVLIPVDHPAQALADNVQPSEKLPLAYVPKELLEIWRDRRARRAGPAVLLATANYHAEVADQQVTLKAEFLVHRLRPSEPTQLSLPFVTVPLGADHACLVDGQPRSLVVNERRDALQLELPALEQPQSDDGRAKVVAQRVSLTLLPPMVVEESVSRVTLPIPPVLQSTLVLKPLPRGAVEASRRRGEAFADSTTGTWSAQLGQISQLAWEIAREGVVRPRPVAESKADVACLIELSPTYLRQRYRARYTVSAGELHDAAWTVPRGVLIRDGDVQADDLLQWALEALPDGRQKLMVEFSQPKTGEFTLDVAGLQAPLGTPEHPVWEPWDLNFTDSSAEKPASGATVKLGTFTLGVTALPGFKVAVEPSPHAAVLAEGAFAKAFGNVTLPRQPQTALQVHPLAPLTFQVTPLSPQRKVRQELFLKLGRKAFEWELHAEVTTAESAAFRHDILLAPRFHVDDVSVTEDEAERLVSWISDGTRLTAFLRGETRGIQNVLLQGRDAVPADGQFHIPTRWFADAEITEFSIRVTHDPNWQVQVADENDQPLPPVETGGPVADRPELFLGKFRADANQSQLHVKLVPHEPAGSAEAWTVIASTSNEALTWRHWERLLDDGLITARIHWPTEWITNGTVRLSKSLKELARRQLPDGIELTVQSVSGNDSPRELTFETQVPVGATSAVKVRSPLSLDMRDRRQEWLVAEDLRTWLPESSPGRSLQNLDELPDAVKRWLPGNDQVWLRLAPETSAVEMTKPHQTVAPTPKLLWIDTTVWVADGAITEGRTWLLLQPNGLRRLALHRPDDIQWRAVFVGDKLHDMATANADAKRATANAPSETRDDVVLPLDDLPQTPLVWVTLFWHVDARQKDRIVARRDTQLPMPLDKTLRTPVHGLTLISAGHSEPSSTRGARRVQDWEGRLTRASHILRALQTSPGPLDDSLRHLWEQAQADVAQARQAIEQMPLDVGPAATARERLQAVSADLEVTQGRILPATTASVPGLAVERPRWASDTWLQVPNSWSATADVDPSARLSVIVLDRRWLKWIVAVLAFVAVIPILKIWLRWQTGEWLAAHPYLAWALLGVIWWGCLVPSVIGFGLLLVAVMTAFRQRRPVRVQIAKP